MGEPVTRRGFLKRGAAAATAIAGAPMIVPAATLGRGKRVAPSERITMGCIGVGGVNPIGDDSQGSVNMRSFLNREDTQVVAVCDVDAERRERAKNIVEDFYSKGRRGGDFKGCEAYHDFRDLIARPDIDAVSIAVPDHWHALVAIAAANAGKDIYAEKPLSLTIAEGRAMVEAVKRNGTVFQTGSQLRSVKYIRYGCELVRNGRIGKVHTIRASFHISPSCPPQPEMPVPPGFDYDFWLGPAPWAPYTRMRCHYNFRWVSDYSGGQVTDHGAHYCDLAQWGNGTELTGPVEVEGTGDFPTDGLYNVATAYHIEWTYADGVKLIGEHKGRDLVCVTFEGDKGWLYIGSTLDSEPKSVMTSIIHPSEFHFKEVRDHHRDFLDCIKTREEPIAPIEQAHRSASVCHIGVIAMKLGRKLKWDPDAERFVGDDEANGMLSRAMRAPWTLG